MSDDLGDFFALPAFKPEEALVGLRRQLRDLKPLQEKSTTSPWRFEFKAKPCIELAVANERPAIAVSWTPKLSTRPQWTTLTLSNSAEVRKFVDQIKQQLRRWEDED